MPYTASAGVVANNTFFSSSNGKTGSIISNHDLIRDTISLDYRLFFNRQKNLRPVSVASKPARFIFCFSIVTFVLELLTWILHGVQHWVYSVWIIEHQNTHYICSDSSFGFNRFPVELASRTRSRMIVWEVVWSCVPSVSSEHKHYFLCLLVYSV